MGWRNILQQGFRDPFLKSLIILSYREKQKLRYSLIPLYKYLHGHKTRGIQKRFNSAEKDTEWISVWLKDKARNVKMRKKTQSFLWFLAAEENY